ncbi:MAG: adenylate/guanylate cyclase domain-containing protein, partial [Armatimonadetes bacterium]|nr:adenylate/guanylate cyclase domain-containing protein [Armatimonadota bacterium]
GAMRTREMLDEYFRAVCERLYEKDAIVDHFMGDAVMAFFNQPFRRDDHVSQAVTCALEMQQCVGQLNRQWVVPQPVSIGVGISTGYAAVGTVGSTDPKDYTAIGDVVNIAARLQGEAQAGEILVTEEVYRAVASTFPNAERRSLALKGVPKPVTAYSLSGGAVGPPGQA